MTITISGRDPSILTMSSREIAELTGKRHDNVMRDIRAMLVELYGEGGVLRFEDTHINEQNGQAYPIFRLARREVEILVTGYSITLRAKVIDRLHALEEQSQFGFAVPKSMPEALRLAADLAEQKAALEARIAADQPKVAFAEAVRRMDDTCTIEEFAKAMGTGRNRLFKWLRAQDILLKNNLPYQRYIDCGWFKVVELKPWYDSDGNAHPEFSARITGKGQVGLESRYRNEHRNGLVLIKGGVAS